jgi:hypothetical protein
MKKLTIIFLMLISFKIVSAQGNQQITIIGSVSETDYSPIISANIFDLTSKTGVISDNNGIFRLTIPRKPTTLRISFIGFAPVEKKITNADLKNDTIFLLVVLLPKIEELQSVEISSDRFELAYDKPKIRIIDYDFRPEGLLLLLVEDKDFKLRLVDDGSKTLFDLSIPQKPQSLYKDCFGNLHIEYKDSIYQIFFKNKGFALMEGLQIDEFYDFLLPCVAETENNLFFRDYGLHNQSVFYYLINKSTKQKLLLQKITDKQKLIANDDLYHETARRLGYVRHPMADISSVELGYSRKVNQDMWFYQSVLSIPTYNPLFEIRDSIFIFNHIEGLVYIYNNNGELQRTSSFDYHNNAGWKKELFIDYSSKELFAHLNRKGITYLLQINPDNGQIIGEFKLDKNLYPEHIKIRDGYAYYLYTDRYGSIVSHVYRQKLE